MTDYEYTTHFGFRMPPSDGECYQDEDDLRVPLIAIDNAINSTASGFMGFSEGPPIETDFGATPTTSCGTNVNVIAGRKYKISAQVRGVQKTVTGNICASIECLNGLGTMRSRSIVLAVGVVDITYDDSGHTFYTATASGVEVFYISIYTTSGAYRVPAYANNILIEDIGT